MVCRRIHWEPVSTHCRCWGWSCSLAPDPRGTISFTRQMVYIFAAGDGGGSMFFGIHDLSVLCDAAVGAYPETTNEKEAESMPRINNFSYICVKDPWSDIVKFCLWIGLNDVPVAVHANLGDNRFSCFWMARDRISFIAIDLPVIFTTLSHYNARVWLTLT